jgi:hypothetical protein
MVGNIRTLALNTIRIELFIYQSMRDIQSASGGRGEAGLTRGYACAVIILHCHHIFTNKHHTIFTYQDRALPLRRTQDKTLDARPGGYGK